ADLTLTPLERGKLVDFAGRHPYLLDMLGFNLIEDARQRGSLNVEAVCERTSLAFVKAYEEVYRVLRDAELLSKLAQILFGPVYDVRPQDEEELLRYGLIVERGKGYVAFSQHFADSVRIETRDIDFWPLW